MPVVTPTTAPLARLNPAEIAARVAQCPALPSLGKISQSIQSFLQAEHSFTAEISETVSRDPSLTSRLLRLANSAYYGRMTPVRSIDEAVFFLGTRQIRQLALSTPIVEDFQRLTVRCAFPWRDFWQHCIAVAIMTREVLNAVHAVPDESHYVAGLVHDLGKAVMAWSFPQHFTEIHRRTLRGQCGLATIECEILGMDHAELGAIYMESHQLPHLMIEATRCHHQPHQAAQFPGIIAAVNVADMLVRMQTIGFSGERSTVTWDECLASSGWVNLFSSVAEAKAGEARLSLTRTLHGISTLIESLV